ncbi:hypothetical protein I4U23_031581 [Adineta vaga]|nr:hypothetical protein I4U23_031581 [Adineta vaga]
MINVHNILHIFNNLVHRKYPEPTKDEASSIGYELVDHIVTLDFVAYDDCSVDYQEEEKENAVAVNVDGIQYSYDTICAFVEFSKTHTFPTLCRQYRQNELFLFIESNENKYQNDNRTIEEVARELDLSDQTIEFVQRDAIRPDKVAMNVWRHLCPTVDDKVYVHSIKQVPMATLRNIYAFARLSRPKYSVSYKKMRSDIAANIRQGNKSDRTRRSMPIDQNVPQHDGANADECDESSGDDESDEDDDEELYEDENFDNVRSDVRKSKIVDESSSEEE